MGASAAEGGRQSDEGYSCRSLSNGTFTFCYRWVKIERGPQLFEWPFSLWARFSQNNRIAKKNPNEHLGAFWKNQSALSRRYVSACLWYCNIADRCVCECFNGSFLNVFKEYKVLVPNRLLLVLGPSGRPALCAVSLPANALVYTCYIWSYRHLSKVARCLIPTTFATVSVLYTRLSAEIDPVTLVAIWHLSPP
ncbi:hypothetical protein CEXT_106381 [Caerostris extrusa]|uniref:Uncharacterized protein n=1 Tax=Caerostris extrusa TaxID=172846 RepID=A0AAV4VNL4_CAEEX|nr:hypothetical protein CEXT_106381 [Caerostris extrusa]